MRLLLLLLLLGLPGLAEPELATTVLGTQYRVDPRFGPVLKTTINRLREQIRAERARGKLVGFLSLPLSSRGGGNYRLNLRASEVIKSHLEDRFGEQLYVLSPGLVEADLPDVDGVRASGGEYMFMWTQVLAGEKGLGEDFDVIFFAGPSDFARALGLRSECTLDELRDFMKEWAAEDAEFAATVATPEQQRAFLRYYGFKVSATFSDGAHDEWNLFQKVNANRRQQLGIGEQLPLWFDGRPLAPGAAEAPVSPGYEVR